MEHASVLDRGSEVCFLHETKLTSVGGIEGNLVLFDSSSLAQYCVTPAVLEVQPRVASGFRGKLGCFIDGCELSCTLSSVIVGQ